MNNEIRNTKYESRAASYERRGFTLVELVIAIGIMSLVILFAGTIFKSSINSYRIASAQAEIMQKLRAVTDQLNNDFRGLRKDAPMFILFQVDPIDVNNRLDQVMFFADGDFQSTQTYNLNTNPGLYNGYIIPQPSDNPVISNLARIYYGQAKSIDPRDNTSKLPYNLRYVDRILSRRQHLSITNPDTGNRYAEFPLNISGVLIIPDTSNPVQNDWFEHDTNSLSQWQAAAQNSTSVGNIITGCFGNAPYYFGDNRPYINLTDANTMHLLMTQKVGSFSVQWSYFYTDVLTGLTHIYWWPSIDPDGNGNFSDSDFSRMPTNPNPFGFYFNTVGPPAPANLNWFSYGNAVYLPDAVVDPVYPRALKFTFTLYDSRGVFKDGQTFTHIVYIGD